LSSRERFEQITNFLSVFSRLPFVDVVNGCMKTTAGLDKAISFLLLITSRQLI